PICRGPIFNNILLADEINRAPAKVQSALLEAMEEKQVTVGHHTYKLPELYMVIATQNPIEQEGTYNLPEAQLDRFMMHLEVDYPIPQKRFSLSNWTKNGNPTTPQPHCPLQPRKRCWRQEKLFPPCTLPITLKSISSLS